jgi:predicted dienelactone hydrolase
MRLIAALAFALTACQGTPDDAEDTDVAAADPATPEAWIDALAAAGPYQVGFRETSVTYTDKLGQERTLRVDVWYPTNATSGAEASYLGGAIPAPGIWLEAEPAPGEFPLVLFSHGHQGGAENLSRTFDHMVTHGWVVVAPEHTGNTTFDLGERDTQIYWRRPTDVSATLDHVLGADPISAHLDGRILAVGHSFGGYTMWPLAGASWDVDDMLAKCVTDPDGLCSTWTDDDEAIFRAGAADDRIQAFATLSSGDFDRFNAVGVGTVDRPMMLVTGDLDEGNPEKTAQYWDALPDGTYVRATLAHGDHQSYGDYAGSTSIPGTHPDHLDGDRSRRITEVLLGAWGAREVLGKSNLDGVLDGSVEIDADLTVEAQSR